MLDVSGISYAYEDGRTALRKVTFRVEKGEKVVLLGSNGSGKTTLLKILNGLLFPAEGSFRYKGQTIGAGALADGEFHRTFRREVAYLFQNPDSMMFNPTVYEEIAFGPRQLGSDSVDAKVRSRAEELGIEGLLDRNPFRLSGGEKQKVCLAALLVLDPEVLLLDEPAANLDPRSTGWLVDFLEGLGTTTVVTTHNLSLAPELGHRTLVLSENHELLFDGPVEDVLGDKEKLLRANLMHIHKHRHCDVEHRHYHTHDWE
jgi:cobalt/nickel transport system ATP-binding protein